MKTLLTILSLLFTLALNAQTVRIPLFVEVPLQTNTNIVTNVYYINTNVFNSGPAPLVMLQNDFADARLGSRLVRAMNAPANFTFGGTTNGAQISLYWLNPGRFPITWPTNAFWFGNIPTNQPRGAILAERVMGELWLSN